MADETRASLWLDRDEDPPAWTVSIDEDGRSETVLTFPEDDEEMARQAALALGQERQIPVVERRPAGC